MMPRCLSEITLSPSITHQASSGVLQGVIAGERYSGLSPRASMYEP
jgi:hypothetical protein